jgi:hypothetical protein
MTGREGALNPNLQIRSSRHIVQDRPLQSVCWAGIPELSVQDRRCTAAWQQYWLQSLRSVVRNGHGFRVDRAD